MELKEFVTILILVDGFLQWDLDGGKNGNKQSHNPYFSRWFSAIREVCSDELCELCHNPYFSRWFSAIVIILCLTDKGIYKVTILILVDGFLQFIPI